MKISSGFLAKTTRQSELPPFGCLCFGPAETAEYGTGIIRGSNRPNKNLEWHFYNVAFRIIFHQASNDYIFSRSIGLIKLCAYFPDDLDAGVHQAIPRSKVITYLSRSQSDAPSKETAESEQTARDSARGCGRARSEPLASAEPLRPCRRRIANPGLGAHAAARASSAQAPPARRQPERLATEIHHL